MCQSPWIYLEAEPQTTGEDEVDNKETGGKEDLHKDKSPKVLATILTMHALIAARLDTLPKIVPKGRGWGLNPI